MKKTYIQPKTSIIAADVQDDLMISGSASGEQILDNGGNTSGAGPIDVDAREVIRTNSAWDNEW